MSAILVQNKGTSATSGGTTQDATLNAAPTAGNLIIIVFMSNSTVASMTPPAGFSVLVGVENGLATASIEIYYKLSDGTEGTTFTLGCALVANCQIEIYEFSGINKLFPVDTSSSNVGATSGLTSIQPNSITPAEYSEVFIVGACQTAANGGTEAIGSGFNITDASVFDRLVTGYKIKTDATAENPSCSWLTARGASAAQGAFKSALPTTWPKTILRPRPFLPGVAR